MLPCPAQTVGSARPPAGSFPSQSAHCLPSTCISSHACVNSAPCSLSPSRPCVYWVSLGEALPSSIHRTELGAQTSCWQTQTAPQLRQKMEMDEAFNPKTSFLDWLSHNQLVELSSKTIHRHSQHTAPPGGAQAGSHRPFKRGSTCVAPSLALPHIPPIARPVSAITCQFPPL